MDAPATPNEPLAATVAGAEPDSASDAPPVALGVRIEPSGPSAERAIAVACAGGPLRRDGEAPIGQPAAIGDCTGGEDALAQLVRAAALALDDTDLHLTVRRR